MIYQITVKNNNDIKCFYVDNEQLAINTCNRFNAILENHKVIDERLHNSSTNNNLKVSYDVYKTPVIVDSIDVDGLTENLYKVYETELYKQINYYISVFNTEMLEYSNKKFKKLDQWFNPFENINDGDSNRYNRKTLTFISSKSDNTYWIAEYSYQTYRAEKYVLMINGVSDGKIYNSIYDIKTIVSSVYESNVNIELDKQINGIIKDIKHIISLHLNYHNNYILDKIINGDSKTILTILENNNDLSHMIWENYNDQVKVLTTLNTLLKIKESI